MPVNLYRCAMCGHVYSDKQTCIDCESGHTKVQNSVRYEYEWDDDGKCIPHRIRILIPAANNKPYGDWAGYTLTKTGGDRTQTRPQPSRRSPHRYGRPRNGRQKGYRTTMTYPSRVPGYGRPNNWPKIFPWQVFELPAQMFVNGKCIGTITAVDGCVMTVEKDGDEDE